MQSIRAGMVGLAGLIALTVLAAIAPPRAAALIMLGGKGFISDPGWPDGALPMANLKTRAAWWEGPGFGGGNYHFQYIGKETEEFNDALAVFAGILVPRLELVVMDGMPAGGPAQEKRIDWEFEIWNPEAFYRINCKPGDLFLADSPWHNQPLPPPRVTLYLGGENPVAWEKVKVPGKITVLDKRVAGKVPPGVAAAEKGAERPELKDSKGGVVSAVVRELASGKVIRGATLTLVQYAPPMAATTRTLTTDANGEAVLRDLPKGSYEISTRVEGFVTREAGYFSCFGRNVESFDIALARPAALKGTVKDTQGKPLEGVKISARDTVGLDGQGYKTGDRSVRTDAQGRFELKDLPRGYTILWADKPGYYYFSREIHAIGDMTRSGKPNELEIVMGRSGVISGKVKGLEKAKGEKAQVMVNLDPVGDPIGKWGGSMNVKEDGSFEFKGVPAGQYILHASLNPTSEKREEAQPRVTIDFSGDQSRQVELELK